MQCFLIFLSSTLISIISSSSTKIRRFPIAVLDAQAREVWRHFSKHDASIKVEFKQDRDSEVTLFSAYAGTSKQMTLLFAIESSTKQNQVILKFRTEKDQIKSYILTARYNDSEFHKLIFSVDSQVFQLSVDCNQLIKTMDRHITFRTKRNQTDLKLFLGDVLRQRNIFQGVIRNYALDKGNPIYSECKNSLKVTLSEPVKIALEEGVVTSEGPTADQGKDAFEMEMLARRVELEKNIKERLNKLEEKLDKWQNVMQKLESRMDAFERIHFRSKRSSKHRLRHRARLCEWCSEDVCIWNGRNSPIASKKRELNED